MSTSFAQSLGGDWQALLLRTALLVGLITPIARWYYNSRQRRREEDEFALKHGCQPIEAVIPHKWPFGFDLLKKQWDVLPSGRVLEAQTPYMNIAPTLVFPLFGGGLLTVDPENLEALLNSRFEDFGLGSRRMGLLPLLGEGIFTQDGLAWKHSRKLLRRQFSRISETGLSAFDNHASILIDSLQKEAKSNPAGVVDMQPLFFDYTLSTTTELLFGEPHSSLPQKDRDTLRDDFDYAAMFSAIRLRLADLAWVYTSRRFRDSCKGVRDWATFFADKALAYLEEHGEEAAMEKYGFIVEQWQETHDRDVVRDQLLHVLVAGRDTTACLLSWTIFLLVRNPDVLARLKKEIEDGNLPKSEELTRKHIQQLPYLRCCLNETLRLYPQLPVNVRFATKTTLLPRGGGPDGKAPLLVKKGVGIGWSTYHMHRREEIYGSDARVFRPSRWEDGKLAQEVGYGFLDFHGGPRVCLGKDYALMEASYAIIRILQRYPEIRLPPGEPNEPPGAEKQHLGLVLTNADGVKVLLE
ncbi:cytochrome p450 domain-containing protein [Sarocladium implicatum]|nr:cytochrome p450 domain-containing protein [Sarocladium implicatum]